MLKTDLGGQTYKKPEKYQGFFVLKPREYRSEYRSVSSIDRRTFQGRQADGDDHWPVTVTSKNVFPRCRQNESPNTEYMSFICMPNEEEYEMSRNFADVSQTITVLTEIYWDLRSEVSVSCRTMIWFYFEDWFKLMSLMLIVCEASYKCYR